MPQLKIHDTSSNLCTIEFIFGKQHFTRDVYRDMKLRISTIKQTNNEGTQITFERIYSTNNRDITPNVKTALRGNMHMSTTTTKNETYRSLTTYVIILN